MVLVLACILIFPLPSYSPYALGTNSFKRGGSPTIRQQAAAEAAPSKSGIAFTYKFENARFYIPLIDLQVNADRTAELSFKQGESDDTIDQTFTVRPETMNKLVELTTRSRFLESDEDYQSKKDFSHLGWITITATEGGHHRTARFNYSQNKDVSDLAEIFRAVATQWIDLFHINVAVEHQPLDLPAQLDVLENDLQIERLAEPESLVGPLRDISQDDTLPLIARNHANKIITAIQKKKYKSPIRPGR
ncbi:MAG: hypothetical protein ACREDR_45205 [Blastocatellia bacterium]